MQYIGHIDYDKRLREDYPIVIYGAGYWGRIVFKIINKNIKKENVKCFCDENKDLWKMKIEGIEVMSPEKAAKKYPYAHFVVSGIYAKEMVNKLHVLHIQNIHLLLCD